MQIADMEKTERDLLDRIKKTSDNVIQFGSLYKATNEMNIEAFENIILMVRKNEREAVQEGRLA